VAELGSNPEWSFVTFNAVGVRFYFGHDADPKELRKPRLYFDARLDARNPVKLTEGLSIEETRLGIAIDPMNGDGQEAPAETIGVIGYSAALEDGAFKFPQTISADLSAPQAVFDELVSAARQGRCPAEIILTIEGLKASPGASGIELSWDNSENGRRLLPIRGVTFRMHFVEPLEADGKAVSLDVSPPTAGRLQAAKQADAIARRLGGITVLLGLLFLVLLGMLLWQVFR